MGGGNGAKAAQRRERNTEKNKKAAGSQLKSIEAAKTIVCAKCKQSFISTMRKPALTAHAEVCCHPMWYPLKSNGSQNKHSMKFEGNNSISFWGIRDDTNV